MNREQNKTLIALQEEEKKHELHERKNLIIGVIIFILMLPLDYVIIEKVSEYKANKQKTSATLNLNTNRSLKYGQISNVTRTVLVTIRIPESHRSRQIYHKPCLVPLWIQVTARIGRARLPARCKRC